MFSLIIKLQIERIDWFWLLSISSEYGFDTMKFWNKTQEYSDQAYIILASHTFLRHEDEWKEKNLISLDDFYVAWKKVKNLNSWLD